jgi:hypothetical protein
MKTTTFLTSAVLITAVLFSGCKKKEDKLKKDDPAALADPAQVQNAVVFYFGGSWCGVCGENGKPSKDAIKSELGDRATIISCQLNGTNNINDPMNSPTANALKSPLKVFGIPSLVIGGANDVITTVPYNTMKTNAVSTANAAKDKAPIAAINATFSLSGNTLAINSKTKFFADQTEEYYIAPYILESGLDYKQSNDQSANINVHDNVVRANAASKATGDLLSGNNKKDEVKTKAFTVTLNDTWKKENIQVALVLWKKNTDGSYTICNGFNKKIQ